MAFLPKQQPSDLAGQAGGRAGLRVLLLQCTKRPAELCVMHSWASLIFFFSPDLYSFYSYLLVLLPS